MMNILTNWRHCEAPQATKQPIKANNQHQPQVGRHGVTPLAMTPVREGIAPC